MNTLKDMIDALILITELALILRFVICCIQESDQEDQPQVYKKQKRTAVIALIVIVCVYDIPKLINYYLATPGW